jgi:hypothetical protein
MAVKNQERGLREFLESIREEGSWVILRRAHFREVCRMRTPTSSDILGGKNRPFEVLSPLTLLIVGNHTGCG